VHNVSGNWSFWSKGPGFRRYPDQSGLRSVNLWFWSGGIPQPPHAMSKLAVAVHGLAVGRARRSLRQQKRREHSSSVTTVNVDPRRRCFAKSVSMTVVSSSGVMAAVYSTSDSNPRLTNSPRS
jgi:hypothetical protein